MFLPRQTYIFRDNAIKMLANFISLSNSYSPLAHPWVLQYVQVFVNAKMNIQIFNSAEIPFWNVFLIAGSRESVEVS